MAAARDVLKNLNLFVDGRGHAGNIDSYTPPPLTLLVDDHRAGGMDAPLAIDMGMEAMETSIGLTAYDRDVLALFGVAEGQTVPFVARGALESYDGTVTPVVHTMRGRITSIDPGEWKAGEKAILTITLRLNYFKQEHGGQLIHEIDVENMKRIINGVDRLAAIRSAMGM